MKLTSTQTALLNVAAKAGAEYRYAKVNLEAELRARMRLELDEALSTLKNRQDTSVFRAHQSGVPKSRIGVEALNSKNPQTTTDAVERGKAILEGSGDDVTAHADLLAAARADELANAAPLWVDPRNGKPFCSNSPFSFGTGPNSYILTFTNGLDPLPFYVENGHARVRETEYAHPGAFFLMAQGKITQALNAAAATFAANAENS